MITPPTDEFLLMAAVVAVSTAYGVYMAARTRPEPRSEFVDVTTNGDDAMPEQQLTFEDALAQRDAVLAEVAENNTEWIAAAIEAFQELPDGERGTGEDFRLRLREMGLRAPGHANAWGAFFNAVIRRGLLKATGEWRPMRVKSSHGRETKVYVKVAPEGAA